MMKINLKLATQITLSVLAFIAAGYSSYLALKSDSTICNISVTFNCSSVNGSEYSKIFDIPIAYIGLLLPVFNVLFLLFWNLPYFNHYKKKLEGIIIAALILNTLGAMGSILLLYLQFFVINSICIFCLVYDISIIGFTILLFADYLKSSDKN